MLFVLNLSVFNNKYSLLAIMVKKKSCKFDYNVGLDEIIIILIMSWVMFGLDINIQSKNIYLKCIKLYLKCNFGI
jgi:hypothetical protein